MYDEVQLPDGRRASEIVPVQAAPGFMQSWTSESCETLYQLLPDQIFFR